MMMLRNWSPITKLSNTPDVTVEQTSDTVLWMLFRRTWVMAWSMLLATMQEPKHMAQRMSQMVSSIPAMPRVATKSLMEAKPVSTCVLV